MESESNLHPPLTKSEKNRPFFVQDLGEGRRRGQDALFQPGQLTSGPNSPVLAPIRPLALNSEVRLPGFRKSGRALSPYACVPSSTFPPTALPEDPRVLARRLSSLETIDL